MKKIENFSEVKEYSDFPKLEPGAYPCKIVGIQDFADKEYLHIEFDIAKGDFKDYFKSQQEEFGGAWRGTINRSYKETAIRFFKAFITAIEKSNKGYQWDWDENKLVNKYCYINFREEEYVNKDDELAVAVVPFEIRSIDAFKKGEIKLAPRKELSDEDKARLKLKSNSPETNLAEVDTLDIPEDDLPF